MTSTRLMRTPSSHWIRPADAIAMATSSNCGLTQIITSA